MPRHASVPCVARFAVQFAIGAVCLGLAPAAPAAAAAPPPTSMPPNMPPNMPLGRSAAPPSGFLDYCLRNPGGCGVDPAAPDARRQVSERYWSATFAARRGAFGGAVAAAAAPAPPNPIAWTPQTRALVDRVNRRVNQAIVEQADTVTYGVKDYWAIPTLQGQDRYGDCEDYVLMKRRDLIAEGVAAADLFIALARTREGRPHAVLLIATDQGEMALDSQTPWVVRWDQAPYRWLQRQAPGSPFRWVDPGVAGR